MYRLAPFGMIERVSDGALIPAAPDNTDYATYLEWVAEGNVAEYPTTPLATLKAEKLSEVSNKAEALASVLTQGYPEFEMKTWPQQESESMAWNLDNTAATPMIDIMASNRGIDRTLYLQKTLAKVTAFRQASSKLVGLRQKYSDQVAAATTAEAVAAIDPVYVL